MTHYPPPLNEAIKAALDLPETMMHCDSALEARLLLLYETSSHIMQQIFDNRSEKIPLVALFTCVKQFAINIHSQKHALPTLLKIVSREYTTHYHSVHVGFLAIVLADALGLSHEEIIDIGFSGLLHDIGKIRIDDVILQKPGKLIEEEYVAVKNHSHYGYEILVDNGIINQKVLSGVLYHHERLDGSGYPKGYSAKLIPKYAQIIGMCDTFDALTTKRTFRNCYSSYDALLVMVQDMASQFNRDYIKIFIRLMSA